MIVYHRLTALALLCALAFGWPGDEGSTGRTTTAAQRLPNFIGKPDIAVANAYGTQVFLSK